MRYIESLKKRKIFCFAQLEEKRARPERTKHGRSVEKRNRVNEASSDFADPLYENQSIKNNYEDRTQIS